MEVIKVSILLRPIVMEELLLEQSTFRRMLLIQHLMAIASFRDCLI
ncbi:MAG: hypothetical protein AAGD25_32245 [Cyanobacteria bacterium P01_F01_bin.150]